jgi:hypothetical protein
MRYVIGAVSAPTRAEAARTKATLYQNETPTSWMWGLADKILTRILRGLLKCQSYFGVFEEK